MSLYVHGASKPRINPADAVNHAKRQADLLQTMLDAETRRAQRLKAEVARALTATAAIRNIRQTLPPVDATPCKATLPPDVYNSMLRADYQLARASYENEDRMAGTRRLKEATAEAATWRNHRTHRP